MKRFLKIYLEKPELAGIAFLVLLTVVFQFQSNGIFLSGQNLQGMLGLLPEMGLVAIGVTLLMICGEFDLSVGSVFALTPMLMAILLADGTPFIVALPIGLVAAAVIGFVNGFLTIRFSIPSFITTLGMLFVARSITIVISGGFPPLLPADALPKWLFTVYVGPGNLFRMSFFWFLGVAILASVLLSATNFGNWIRATGGFLPAAQSMGIPTAKVKIACFMLCSVLAGFAGAIQVMRLGAPLPSIGEGLELQAVAAAVIGGTALAGGIGTIFGGIIGAALIRVIDNGLVLSQADAN
ncbi:MAG: ABC transporter permease, partial [Geminicoccaceae bacterium]